MLSKILNNNNIISNYVSQKESKYLWKPVNIPYFCSYKDEPIWNQLGNNFYSTCILQQ